MICALTAYPLSQLFKQEFETTIGAVPQYMTLAELRRMTWKDLIARLRSSDADKFIIPLEDVSASALLPVLEVVAAISKAGSIEVVYPDLKSRQVQRWQVAASLVFLLACSVSAAVAAVVCKLQLFYLSTQKRIVAHRKQSNSILYLKTNFWIGVKAGGSVGHIAGVVNALMERGLGVDFASAQAPAMVRPGVRFLLVPFPKGFGLPPELNLYRFQRHFVSKVRSAIRNREHSFIYQRMSLSNYAGVILSRQRGIPLVLEYNGSEAWVAKNWGRPLVFQRLAVHVENVCLKHAHLVVTVSDVLRQELINRGVEPERIVCYPNCVDPEIFDPEKFGPEKRTQLRKQHGIRENAIVATFVGTFGQWHGVDVLARAIRHLRDTEPAWLEQHDVHFLLVGDGLKMPEVREILGNDSCSEFVTITGLVPQAQAPDYLAISDILLSPHVDNTDGSRFFGSPTKLFEYMAMGKAIVASDLEQIGEILDGSQHVDQLDSSDGAERALQGCALLVSPGAVEELETAIRFMVKNAGARVAMGRMARERVLEKYTWKHHVEALFRGPIS
ncbi:MAG: glycosyltransferase family 4 protein [Gammaproteobacteria bacterium]